MKKTPLRSLTVFFPFFRLLLFPLSFKHKSVYFVFLSGKILKQKVNSMRQDPVKLTFLQVFSITRLVWVLIAVSFWIRQLRGIRNRKTYRIGSSLIYQFIILVYKMSKNCHDVFKLLVLSYQQPKTQKY